MTKQTYILLDRNEPVPFHILNPIRLRFNSIQICSMNIQPGGSLFVAWQIKSKPVLVVGAGDVAQGRVENLLDADAIVTIVAPEIANRELRQFLESEPKSVTFEKNRVTLGEDGDKKDSKSEDQEEEEVELTSKLSNTHISSIPSISPKDLLIDPKTNKPKYSMVLTAINAPGVSEAIYKVCAQYNIPANVADVPPLCDFYFASTIRRGPLQVAVSTNGSAPRLARNIRADVEHSLDSLGDIEQAIEKVGILRAKLKVYTDNHPELHKTQQEKIKMRMKWMSEVCDNWSYPDLACLDERLMDRLIEKYPSPPLT